MSFAYTAEQASRQRPTRSNPAKPYGTDEQPDIFSVAPSEPPAPPAPTPPVTPAPRASREAPSTSNEMVRATNSALDRFLTFHEENAHVAQELLRKTLMWKRKGLTQGRIGSHYEALRDSSIEVRGVDLEYKLNNDLRAGYARLLEAAYPALNEGEGVHENGWFEKRTSKIDDGEFDWHAYVAQRRSSMEVAA